MNKYRYEQIEQGMEESFCVTITEDMLEKFSDITGDCNPLHNDTAYAKGRGYEGRVCYGMLTASFLSTLAGVYMPGERSLIHSVETKFVKPVFVGDTLTVCATVAEKNDLFSAITLKILIKNQNGDKVVRGKMQIGVYQEKQE